VPAIVEISCHIQLPCQSKFTGIFWFITAGTEPC
jgi:hypothetical protein